MSHRRGLRIWGLSSNNASGPRAPYQEWHRHGENLFLLSVCPTYYHQPAPQFYLRRCWRRANAFLLFPPHWTFSPWEQFWLVTLFSPDGPTTVLPLPNKWEFHQPSYNFHVIIIMCQKVKHLQASLFRKSSFVQWTMITGNWSNLGSWRIDWIYGDLFQLAVINMGARVWKLLEWAWVTDLVSIFVSDWKLGGRSD